ncbi:MAG: DUF2207 domain-containing protein [Pseudomonadota bacterium]
MRHGLFGLLLLPATLLADERILDFYSEIRVQQDGWIEVTETIRVRAEGNRIRRGLYRDLPTEYTDRFMNRYEVSIEPLAVLRNDAREDYHTVKVRRGQRTYFGHEDRLLAVGEHTYTFRYRASRMLGFFEEHDELYWNVTGFDWAFPIDRASARVYFDFDADASTLTHEAYTGPFGARGTDYTSRITPEGAVEFISTRPLSAVNGMTIVVGWPKGLIAPPTALDRAGWLINDNVNLLVALAGFVLLLGYYYPVWSRHGRDPEAGVIIPRYEPPRSFSPASLRYIQQMYYDNKVMTAAIVNLAVKGYLLIKERGDMHWLERLQAPPEAPAPAPGEKELYEALFSDGLAIELDNENHRVLGRARAEHAASLQEDYKSRYFQTNVHLNVPGVVIVIGTAIAAFNIGNGITPLVAVALGLSVVTILVFAILLKRPTLRGRELLDEMLGFKDYLEVAEKDELNLRNPPDKTPELFESYLPYALALGVEQEWSEKFERVLAAVRRPDGGAYQPRWYDGSWNSNRLGRTARSLSSGLTSSVASSVSPPGSSSGSGGGGSSGGGGGGGGGGGW